VYVKRTVSAETPNRIQTGVATLPPLAGTRPRFLVMAYAIISVGGKQYRVSEGQKLLVDRVRADEGKTFTPRVLMLGGDGDPNLSPDGSAVTARVVQHVLGEKIRIGKYRPKKGYKKHTGYRSRLSQIEIEAIGGGAKATRAKKDETPAVEQAEAAPTRTAHPPKGYEELTVAQIKEQVGSWRRPNIEAALEYEREHDSRKGAIEALEAAIAAKEGD
jgi:large subunit ribosomal protein L21